MSTRVVEVEAKSILVPTKVPSADYVINPYTGCEFGCMYCFASFMGRSVGETNADWGDYVYVKTNAVELADKEIQRLLAKDPHPRIQISTVTDPYQRSESKYRLTRGILGVFASHDYQGRVSLLTKSPLVTKDIDVIAQLADAEVGLTITTSDDSLSRQLEVRAPKADSRLKALRRLNEAGIHTYVFVGPLLPHMTQQREQLDTLLGAIAATGTTDVKVEYLNLPRHVRPRMKDLVAAEPAEIQAAYAASQDADYRAEVEPLVRGLLDRHGLTLRFGELVVHVEDQALIDSRPEPADG